MTRRGPFPAVILALRRLLRADRSGSIVVLTALSLILLVGAAAMALDLAKLYLARSTAQRIADQSALAAAFAYGQSGDSEAAARSAAASLALANGAGDAAISTDIVASPSQNGNKAAWVVVTSPVPLSPFGQIGAGAASAATGAMSVNVSAAAYAEIQGNVAPCVVALGAYGIVSSDGTSLTATGCAVASAGSVTASNAPGITAQAVYAVGTISPSTCSGTGGCVQTSPSSGQLFPGSSTPADPYADAGIFSRQPTVAAMTAAMFPSVGTAPSGGSAQTCTAASSTLTLGPGSYGRVSTSGNPPCTTIVFTGGPGTETDISGGLYLDGPNVSVSFGPGIYRIANGISTGSSVAAAVSITGFPTIDIWGGISIGAGSSLTVAGSAAYYVLGGIVDDSGGAMVFNDTDSTTPSTFYVAGGIAVANGFASFPDGRYIVTSGDTATGAGIDLGNGATATFGNGSFDIAGGIEVGNGGKLAIGNQLGSRAVFRIPTTATNGDAIATGGGSTLTLGAFGNDDINGPVTLAGEVHLGSGTYTIAGALNAASDGGCCITGSGVTVVASGAINIGAGYGTVALTAPTAADSTTQGAAGTVVLASNANTASTVTADASDASIVGAVYLPHAVLTLDGVGALGGAGGCLELLAGSVIFDGSGAVTTDCRALGNAGAASSVALVQ